MQPRRLLTFALNGKAVLPPCPPREMTVKAVDDPSIEIKGADVEAGRYIYMRCLGCHGRNLLPFPQKDIEGDERLRLLRPPTIDVTRARQERTCR